MEPKTKTHFTPRQQQIAPLLARGLSNSEVAAELGISPRTVRAHTDELRRRLGVSKRRYIAFAYFEAMDETLPDREPKASDRSRAPEPPAG